MFVQRMLIGMLLVVFFLGMDSSLLTANAATEYLRPRPPAPRPAPPAPPAPNQQAQFVFNCARGQTAPVDPIVMPGHTGMSHMHQFFGNRTTDENSTFESLFAARSSNCRMRGDFSAYWVPALYNGDVMVLPRQLRTTYRRSTAANVSLPPDGLMLIAGDAKATSEQPLSVVSWQCSGRNATPSVTPPVCTRGDLVAKITFPECWDGASVDSANHKSHVQFAVDGVCAAGTVPIPQVVLEVIYPRQATVDQLRLASGSILTMHADFFNAWDQRDFTNQINRRLNSGN